MSKPLKNLIGMKSLPCKEPSKFFPFIEGSPFKPDLLRGKIALVTGGGTGIGEAIARRLATSGASVVIASRKNTTTELAKQLAADTGAEVVSMQLDVREETSALKVYEEIEKTFGAPCNLLINNAGRNLSAPSETIPISVVKEIWDTVAFGSFNMTKLLYGRNKFLVPTTVLNLTAHYVGNAVPYNIPVAMAKSAVDTMTKSLANEFAKGGFRILSLEPGPTHGTEGVMNLGEAQEGAIQEAYKELTPTGRIAYVNELANMAAFLCSDFSSAITGTSVTIDGGMHSVMLPQNMLHDIPRNQWKSGTEGAATTGAAANTSGPVAEKFTAPSLFGLEEQWEGIVDEESKEKEGPCLKSLQKYSLPAEIQYLGQEFMQKLQASGYGSS